MHFQAHPRSTSSGPRCEHLPPRSISSALAWPRAVGDGDAGFAVEVSPYFYGCQVGQIAVGPVDLRRHAVDIDERRLQRRIPEFDVDLAPADMQSYVIVVGFAPWRT